MGNKLPNKMTAARYNITTRTLYRWRKNPDLRFPTPEIINGRAYDDEDDLQAWDRSRVPTDLRTVDDTNDPVSA